MRAALRAVARELQPQRDALRMRAAVVASDIALEGRDLAEQARWAALLADEVAARGVPVATAALLAAAGGAAFRTVYTAWLADPACTALDTRLDEALDTLAAALV